MARRRFGGKREVPSKRVREAARRVLIKLPYSGATPKNRGYTYYYTHTCRTTGILSTQLVQTSCVPINRKYVAMPRLQTRECGQEFG